MNIEINENERIDDLEYKGLKIIQNTEGFCFGIDAVLLSDFAKEIKNNSKVLDLGTGTGILSILLAGKTNLKKVYGIEIQEQVSDMANRSVKLNDLEDRIEIINKNIKDLETIFEKNYFDAIVTNPPYKKINTGKKNEKENKLISRHEITASLEDFIKISFKLLKDKGSFYMVHRPERLADIFCIMRKYKIEPKRVQMVHPNTKKPANILLVEGQRDGGAYLKWEPPIYVYNDDGSFSKEINEIYGRI